MPKITAEQRKAFKRSQQRTKALRWTGVVGVLALAIYGGSQMSCVPYTERDIAVVDFSELSRSEKNAALVAANGARCTCGCGMTLARCVSTDSTCPIRDGNIKKIRQMVAEARAPRQGS
jgi:hypothetical protein